MRRPRRRRPSRLTDRERERRRCRPGACSRAARRRDRDRAPSARARRVTTAPPRRATPPVRLPVTRRPPSCDRDSSRLRDLACHRAPPWGPVTTVMRMRPQPAVVSSCRRPLLVAGVAALALGETRRAGADAGERRRLAGDAPARRKPPTTDKDGVQHLHFEYGPLDIAPGQNLIETNKFLHPATDRGRLDRRLQAQPAAAERQGAGGRRAAPAPRRVGGRDRPRRDRVRCSPSASSPPARRRPRSSCRAGYGYRYRPTDAWYLNYMIHNLTAEAVHRCRSPTTSTSCPRRRRRRRR